MEAHHEILHVRISLGYKFHLQQKISIFQNKFTPKRILSIKIRKNVRHR